MKSIFACEHGEWSIYTQRVSDPSEWNVIPFRCRSWRHEGECSLWRGAQDFNRISEAIESRVSWTYIVLTYAHAEWEDEATLYRAGVTTWRSLRKRMIRRFGPMEYIQTWERHRSGWPHVNVLVCNEKLAAECSGEGWRDVRQTWLIPEAVAAGFGKVCYIKPMISPRRMAGYLTKLAMELTGAGPKDQVPRNAPPHFRRIRASRGLLPPPHKDPDLTGKLWRAPADIVEALYTRWHPRKAAETVDGIPPAA